MRTATLAVAVLLCAASAADAQAGRTLAAVRAMTPPHIDGVLDDAIWQEAPLELGPWRSYNPLRGDTMASQFSTEVHIAYDAKNVYFAFHCFDADPGRIRATVAKRDNAFNDDWIAISLDSAGTKQMAYHLFMNPLGMQMDAANTPASGEQMDVDFIWYSVGHVTTDGYVLEAQVPLQTLRFASGPDVSMGVLFMRKISRIGVSYSWPEMQSGEWVFDRHARLQFKDLHQPRLVEALPSVVYSVNQTRDTASRWGTADGATDVGLSGKLGLTSTTTLEGTLNPDFSQVESDAFQVQVNQRFPLFFSEKRPFFMEGMGLFNVAGTGGDSNMRTAVHTRRVVDPLYGAKLTGTAGRATFGVLHTLDEHPLDVEEGLSSRKVFTIGRAVYPLRGADYLGAIAADTERDGRTNRVVGADFSMRPSVPQHISFSLLRSTTATPGAGDSQGISAQAQYEYSTRRFTWSNQAERVDRGFAMDTAFYNRTGFTSLWSFGDWSIYPGRGQSYWLQRFRTFYFAKAGHDEAQDGDEAFLNAGVRLHLTRQGYVEIGRSGGTEAWRGREFRTGRNLNIGGNGQVLRWLNINARYNVGPSVYYDDVAPYQGRSSTRTLGVTVQPNAHFSQKAEVNLQHFERASTGERVFDVTIVNARTTYQFDRHLLVRLLEQYDSSVRRLLTDFLASYEVVPGTVFHAGYGSLYERRRGPADALVPVAEGQRYLSVSRGLFFKASYLRRF